MKRKSENLTDEHQAWYTTGYVAHHTHKCEHWLALHPIWSLSSDRWNTSDISFMEIDFKLSYLMIISS